MSRLDKISDKISIGLTGVFKKHFHLIIVAILLSKTPSFGVEYNKYVDNKSGKILEVLTQKDEKKDKEPFTFNLNGFLATEELLPGKFVLENKEDENGEENELKNKEDNEEDENMEKEEKLTSEEENEFIGKPKIPKVLIKTFEYNVAITRDFEMWKRDNESLDKKYGFEFFGEKGIKNFLHRYYTDLEFQNEVHKKYWVKIEYKGIEGGYPNMGYPIYYIIFVEKEKNFLGKQYWLGFNFVAQKKGWGNYTNISDLPSLIKLLKNNPRDVNLFGTKMYGGIGVEKKPKRRKKLSGKYSFTRVCENLGSDITCK